MIGWLLGGSSIPGRNGYVVNNRPMVIVGTSSKLGCEIPFQTAMKMAKLNGGDPH